MSFNRPSTHQNRLAKKIFSLALLIGIGINHTGAEDDPPVAMVVGIHHMERGFRVDKFYLDSGFFGTIGPEGGGGGHACCVTLPRKWRPRLFVDVRWSVADYRKANFQEIEKGIWTSVQGEGVYQAQVPIDRYVEPPTRLYVHFLSRGRVRLITDTAANPIFERPGIRESNSTGRWATQGKPRDDYFTEAERKALDEAWRRERKKYGDWR